MSSKAARVLGVTSALALIALVAPALAAATVEPPSIAGESVSHITPTEATLEAEIDTGGVEHGVFYQFQLLPDPGEAPTEIECPPFPPPGFSVCVGPQSADSMPIGFAAGPGTYAVTREISGLRPEHHYFYRVLAAPAMPTEDSVEWEPPALVGASQDFVTSEAAPPEQMAPGAPTCVLEPLRCPSTGPLPVPPPRHPCLRHGVTAKKRRCGHRRHHRTQPCARRKHHC